MLHAAHCAYAGLRCDTLPLLSASTCTGVCTCKLLLPPACCLIVFFLSLLVVQQISPQVFLFAGFLYTKHNSPIQGFLRKKNHLSPVSQWKKKPIYCFLLVPLLRRCVLKHTILDGVWGVNSARSVTTQLLLFMDI